MADEQLITSTTTIVPAADVSAPVANIGSVVHQAFPVRRPEEDANEILVGVRGSILRRVRGRLKGLAEGKSFPWSEVLLAISTLALGGSLGALGSSVPWAVVSGGHAVPNCRAIVFYVMLPLIGVASLVSYFFLRHFKPREGAAIAADILQDLPDPDQTI